MSPCTLFLWTLSLAGGAGPVVAPTCVPWDERAAEHLLNRAGFGARPAEVRAALECGPVALVEDLLSRPEEWRSIEPELFRWEMFGLDHRQLPLEGTDYYGLSRADQVERCKSARHLERLDFLRLYEQFLDSIVAARDPLRDRMTLFWHGFFTTSLEVNKRKFELVHQFQWLRGNALGSYADLLHGIVRDPAMLQYLDNTSNWREHPNENLARELMELFSLGEGSFSERDVKEAARALTGHAGSAEGRYEFLAERHDDGEKTILSVRGRHGARELVDILLARPECALWVARRLLRSFEGLEPAEERLAEYAELLRSSDYELRPFLRRLFLDPRFYRPEAVGTRVKGPFDHFAGACRVLEVQPPPLFAMLALDWMGQGLYRPPSVKGWPEGLDWLATDALTRRSNALGMLLGTLEEEELGEAGGFSGRMLRDLRAALEDQVWRPSEGLLADLRALWPRTDERVADQLARTWLGTQELARPRALLAELLRRERAARGLAEGAWLDDAELSTTILRRAAHFLLALPEAQLG